MKLLNRITEREYFGPLKMTQQDKKVAVITGASSGIGLSLSREFAKKGWNLVLGSRNIHRLEEIKNELEINGITIITQSTDVKIESDCQELINKCIITFGRIDVMVNNAGISMRALFGEVKLHVIKEVMDVNFWGTAYCSHYSLPWLIESKGTLVGVISIAGYIGLPGRSAYSASKFAMRGLLDTIRVENIKKGLNVLVVAPGFTRSDIRKNALNPEGLHQGETPRNEEKMMSSEAVAVEIIRAIDKRKSSLVLTFWEGKFTVFLSKLFPRLLDRLAYAHMAKEPNSPFK